MEARMLAEAVRRLQDAALAAAMREVVSDAIERGRTDPEILHTDFHSYTYAALSGIAARIESEGL